MAQKRSFSEDENENPEENQQRNQRSKIKSTPLISLPTRCLLKYDLLQDPFSQLFVENQIRKVVRDVTEKTVHLYLQSNPRLVLSEVGPSKSRNLKLNFVGQLNPKYYTGKSVKAEGLSPLKVELLDAASERVITDDPLSSAIEIVVVYGDFNVEKMEDWTQEEFDGNIVHPRPDKRPLLIGEREIALRDGIGFVKGIIFGDNSRCVRSHMFRLGAKFKLRMDKEGQVREAVSTPFKVLHRRGENEKHSIPSLNDEVWHLDGISKVGIIRERLAKHQIYKVKDLLQLYNTDQSSLRNIVSSKKVWIAIVKQLQKSFPSSMYLSNLGLPHIPSDPIMPSTSVPYCALVASQDRAEVEMSHTHVDVIEPYHTMALNNPETATGIKLMIEELFCDDGITNLAPLFPLYDLNKLSVLQSILEECCASVSGANGTSQTAKPKGHWAKI